MQNNETKTMSERWNVMVVSQVDNKILEQGIADEVQIRDRIDMISDTCLYYDDEIIQDIKEEIATGVCAYSDPIWYSKEGWYLCQKYFSEFDLLLTLEDFQSKEFSFLHNGILYSFTKVGQ